MRVVYAIRHQVAGIILQKLYLQPPSSTELERVRLAHAVPGRDCWVRVVPLSIEVPETLAEHFSAAQEVEQAPSTEQAGALPRFVIRATGAVSNPR